MREKSAVLPQAIEHHMAGRFDEAEHLYLELHAANPQDEEVLFLLGILSCDLGIFDTACRFLEEALHYSPKFLEARHQLGIALARSGRHGAALTQFQLTLEMEPNRPETQVAAADALIELGRVEEAVARLESLVAADLDHADAWRALGKAALRLGDLARAEACCTAALRSMPDHLDALNLLGLALVQQRQYEAAVAPLTRVLGLAPQLNQARNNLGTALRKLGRLSEAQALFEQALEQDADYVEARVNLADVLRLAGRTGESRGHFEQVLAAAPQMVTALNNFAALMQDLGDHRAALALLDRAAEAAPDNPQIRWNRALSELALGDYAHGWGDFEARWEGCENLRDAYDKPVDRAWRGEAIAGKRVLLWAEQGFGDTLQFIRFAGEVARRGATVIVEAQPQLVAVLRSVPGITTIVGRATDLPEYDLHCPLMSLPHRLGLTLQALPVAESYIAADPARAQPWSTRLQAYAQSRVGLVWAGRSRPGAVDLAAIDARRSVTLQQLSPILAVPGIDLFSLQKDKPEGEAMDAHCIDFSSEWKDFADTAAFIANLDLVISVDTAVAHLAGAMGKPVWLLNRFDSCWRWLRDRDDSPWYPKLRQFRQPKPGDWVTPVQRAAAALQDWRSQRS
jgi:tetratricopeptide (TPR) repeat protein